jgi:prepilin signal peptidase PulO-like enzyme (type II secretory pathway)
MKKETKVLALLMAVLCMIVVFMPVIAFAADESVDVVTLIMQKGLMVFLAVYVICAIIKTIPKIPDWIIPVVALIVGAVLGAFLVGYDVKSIIIGGVSGWAAVGLNQTLKQTILKRIGLDKESEDAEETSTDDVESEDDTETDETAAVDETETAAAKEGE